MVSKLSNSHAIARLNELTNLFAEDWSDNDTFKGYNDYTRDAYKAYSGSELNDIITRINDGTWTDADLTVLQDFGIFDKSTITPTLGTDDGSRTQSETEDTTDSTDSSSVDVASAVDATIPTSLTGWAKSRINFNDQKGVPYD